MKKLILLAREITQKEIELGIGTELSSTRLAPIFKTLNLNVPLQAGKPYKPIIPISPFNGTPILEVPLHFIPHHESVLFGTPAISEKVTTISLQPSKVLRDPAKGTGIPFIASLYLSEPEDILILSPCDQFHSEAVTNALEKILDRIEKKKFECGTLLTTGTRNTAFSFIKVKDDKALEFVLKGTKPKADMIAETMVVACRAKYLRAQIEKMDGVTAEELAKTFPYDEEILVELAEKFTLINSLLKTCETIDDFLAKAPFCDFSRMIHRILIESMTYATVEYQTEWDDLGDWEKIYNSPHYPKDDKKNLVFAQPGTIDYKDCSDSIIANFTNGKMIVQGLKNRIFVAGPRGTINVPRDMDPIAYKKKVSKLKM